MVFVSLHRPLRGRFLVFALDGDIHGQVRIHRNSLALAVRGISEMEVIDVSAVPVHEGQELLVGLLKLHAAIEYRILLISLPLGDSVLLLESVVHGCDRV